MEEEFVNRRNNLSFCSCDKPYFQTLNEVSEAEADTSKREKHTHKIPPVGLDTTYETVTHQVSLKRGQRKQLSPHLDGHTSQAGKRLTAEMLLGLVPKATFAYSLRSPHPKLSGFYFCLCCCCFCVCSDPLCPL